MQDVMERTATRTSSHQHGAIALACISNSARAHDSTSVKFRKTGKLNSTQLTRRPLSIPVKQECSIHRHSETHSDRLSHVAWQPAIPRSKGWATLLSNDPSQNIQQSSSFSQKTLQRVFEQISPRYFRAQHNGRRARTLSQLFGTSRNIFRQRGREPAQGVCLATL